MSSGIRINELRLASAVGSDATYGASLRATPGGSFRPLSVIAGPSQTGKTSIVDFIQYCLGAKEHPQHPEVLAAVRSALLEAELDGQPTTIERSATGTPSRFASIWADGFAHLSEVEELRISAEPPSDPDGLSQLILAACDLNGIELPEAPTRDDSPTQLLSIRDVMRLAFLPNERLDNKNLVYEQSAYMVTQKFRQTVDVVFGVHNAQGATIGARHRAAREAARTAAQTASSLRRLAEEDYPRGALALSQDLTEARSSITAITAELQTLDAEQRTTQRASQDLRRQLVLREERATAARIRVRDRRSLLERLSALRAQYADDQRKLTFLREAERLFDPLQVVVCPACLHDLDSPPNNDGGHCSLCGHEVAAAPSLPVELEPEPETPEDVDDARLDTEAETSPAVAPNPILEAELRAVSRRLQSLNSYYERLDGHYQVLVDESIAADSEAEAAARAVDQVQATPAPWLALRDDLSRRLSDARLAAQAAEAGISLWDRVQEADANTQRLEEQAQRLGREARETRNRPDRSLVISALSRRFGEILRDIDYPKLSEPFIDDSLVPHVRGHSYTHASSGGLVLISLAWYLSLWEIAHEREAAAPGFLVIDSPQKNLGHAAVEDSDFADAALVENFYSHAKRWLASDGAGAQLIVVDNSPPESVANDVVVRYTRDPQIPPYGLIHDAVD